MEPAVVFDWAVESRVPIEVTPEISVDSDWVAACATDWAVEMEAATEARVEAFVTSES